MSLHMVASLSVYNINYKFFYINQAESEKAPLLLQNLGNYLLFNKHQEKLHQKFQKCIKYTQQFHFHF